MDESPELLADELTAPASVGRPRRVRVYADGPGRLTAIITQRDGEGPSVHVSVDEWVGFIEDKYPDHVVRIVRHTPQFDDPYQFAVVGETRISWHVLPEDDFIAHYRLDDVNPHHLTNTGLSTRDTLRRELFDNWRYQRLRVDPATGMWRELTERERGIIDGVISALAAAVVAGDKGYCPDPTLLPIIDPDAKTVTDELLAAAQDQYGWAEQHNGHRVLHAPPWKTQHREHTDQVAPGTYTNTAPTRQRTTPGTDR